MHRWTTRSGLVVAAAALAMGGLTACGGDDSDGDSEPVSKDDYCASFNSMFEDLSAMSDDDVAAQIAAIKDHVAELEDLGAPADMPDDAADGLGVFADTVAKIDDDASAEDLDNLGGDVSDADQAKGEAFLTWSQENCPAAVPSDDAS